MSLVHFPRRNAPDAITSDQSGAFLADADRHGNLFAGPDWRQRAIMRGLGFHVTVGAFSTPITGGGAGTIIDLDQPELIVSIPTGYILVPLAFTAQAQVPLLAADADEVEILLAVDRTAAMVIDGTATTETIQNMRTDLGATGSVATARSAFTADVTDPVLDIELARAVLTADSQTAAGVAWSRLDLNYDPKWPMFIKGPAMVVAYWGGTVATPGFAQFQWIELPTGYAN